MRRSRFSEGQIITASETARLRTLEEESRRLNRLAEQMLEMRC